MSGATLIVATDSRVKGLSPHEFADNIHRISSSKVLRQELAASLDSGELLRPVMPRLQIVDLVLEP